MYLGTIFQARYSKVLYLLILAGSWHCEVRMRYRTRCIWFCSFHFCQTSQWKAEVCAGHMVLVHLRPGITESSLSWQSLAHLGQWDGMHQWCCSLVLLILVFTSDFPTPARAHLRFEGLVLYLDLNDFQFCYESCLFFSYFLYLLLMRLEMHWNFDLFFFDLHFEVVKQIRHVFTQRWVNCVLL